MSSLDKEIRCQDKVRFVYVGSVLPDRVEFDTQAFSRAGSLWQENLLTEISSCEDVQLDKVISYRQIESYPRSDKLWIKSESAPLNSRIQLYLLSFINVTPLKQLTIGLGAFIQVILWALRTSGAGAKFVYLYNLSVPSVFFVYAACRLVNVKIIASINDIEIPGNTVPKTIFHRIDYYLQRRLIPRLDGHIVVSEKIIRDFAPGADYLCLEGGVSPEFLSRCSDAKRAYNNSISGDNQSFKIVSFGSLEDINGFRVLIDAFGILRSKGLDNVELYIAGKGSLRQLVVDASNEDVAIKYLGYISHEEVLDYYAKADLLVNLRLANNINSGYFFPSKLLEYLSSGTAVLTTRVGSVSSDLENIVYFLDEESPQYVADALLRIINADIRELRYKGMSAAKFVEENKTWPRQARRVVDYIRHRIDSRYGLQKSAH